MKTSIQELPEKPAVSVFYFLESVGLQLRDFFSSSDAASLQHAATTMQKHAVVPLEPGKTDWSAVEYDFNRLFVGPTAPLAAPYSSIYLDADALLMGKSTMSVRALYNALGLSVVQENAIPDDHISYELEACVWLLKNEEQPDGRDALVWFVDEHLNLWLPPFIEKIKSNAKTPLIASVAVLLSDWLSELKARMLL